MEVAMLAIHWGVSDVHSTACKLSGLSAPFGATTTKFVPAMLSTEAIRMRVATTEDPPPHGDGTEITVQGGHHLVMRNGYYSIVVADKDDWRLAIVTSHRPRYIISYHTRVL